jgi:hypothetical protein
VSIPRFLDHYQKLSLGRRVALRALVPFTVVFIFLRALTYVIQYELLPLHNIVSGLHIHHLFWGILLLMISGFTALASRDPNWHLRIAVLYGIALALTLDEFALWLRLADVYWDPVVGEFLKSRGDGRLIESATVPLPPVRSKVLTSPVLDQAREAVLPNLSACDVD